MSQETNQSQCPPLCSTGCGFYGNPRNNGMCSMCYKDFLQRQNINGHASPTGSSTESSSGTPPPAESSDHPAAASAAQKEYGHCSGITAASAVETSTTADGGLCPVRAAAAAAAAAAAGGGSGSSSRSGSSCDMEGSSSAGGSGTASPTQRSKVNTSPLERQSSLRGKRKQREDDEENTDAKRASEPEASATPSAKTRKAAKAKKIRCFTCNKRLGLLGFDCRCGNVFCSLHRYSDVHNCTFDYKADGSERIRRENPVVVREKVPKI